MTRTVVLRAADAVRWREILEPLGWRAEFRPWMNLVGGAENLSGRDWEPAQGVCGFLESGRLLYVDADGMVTPCCAHPRAAELGDLSRRTFNEIYLGHARRNLVEALEADRGGLSICATCEFGRTTDASRYVLSEAP